MKHKQLAEPVACRYDFDGYGYMYIDAGSGSDWASRVKNCEFLYTHPISEPIENPEQLPIAWVYPEFMENIKDAKCWTAYSTYHKNRPIPLYTHPMVSKSADMLRKQAEEIERLKEQLEDCTCQGGHSEAYLKVKKAREK